MSTDWTSYHAAFTAIQCAFPRRTLAWGEEYVGDAPSAYVVRDCAILCAVGLAPVDAFVSLLRLGGGNAELRELVTHLEGERT